MINERFSKAFKEVRHYLKGIREKDIEKIPNKLLVFLEENESKTYECDFDYTKPLNEINISKEAKGIIAIICLNYWCVTEDDKKEFLKVLNENENKYQSLLREKYNPDNIFKNEKDINLNVNLENKDIEENENNNQNNNKLITIKNNIFVKIFKSIINKVKCLFVK